MVAALLSVLQVSCKSAQIEPVPVALDEQEDVFPGKILGKHGFLNYSRHFVIFHKGVVSGIAMDEKKTPVAGTDILLLDNNKSIVAVEKTDSEGRFNFRSVIFGIDNDGGRLSGGHREIIFTLEMIPYYLAFSKHGSPSICSSAIRGSTCSEEVHIK